MSEEMFLGNGILRDETTKRIQGLCKSDNVVNV